MNQLACGRHAMKAAYQRNMTVSYLLVIGLVVVIVGQLPGSPPEVPHCPSVELPPPTAVASAVDSPYAYSIVLTPSGQRVLLVIDGAIGEGGPEQIEQYLIETRGCRPACGVI